MAHPLSALLAILLCLGACLGWLMLSGRVLDRLMPERAVLIRPWLFLAPAGLIVAFCLVWPLLNTVWLALHGPNGVGFVGFGNFRLLAGDARFPEAFRTTLLWLAVVPAAATGLGLAAAGLTDRLRGGGLVRPLIFLPMATGFVGAAVIWRLVYDYRGGGGLDEIGLLNALWTAAGGSARPWLTQAPLNTWALMAVLVWSQTGFAMVILAAALRTIPAETVEAAQLDGAGPLRIVLRIQAPQIGGAIALVWSALTLMVLKLFDLVQAMTNGQWGTQVLAGLMFDWMFGAQDSGRASAVALVLLVLAVPLLVLALHGVRREARQ
ncbi:MAG: sugar ABC transporter permease [Gemmobacter sp.]|jgi:alpha-glucoside transport system permease protein|nr:sugar ABC transporter permease [Gemmobacter sp.]